MSKFVPNQFHPILLQYIINALESVNPESEICRDLVTSIIRHKSQYSLPISDRIKDLEPIIRKRKASETTVGRTEDEEDDLFEESIDFRTAARESVLPKQIAIRKGRYDRLLKVCRDTQAEIAASLAASGKGQIPYFSNIEAFKEQAKLDDDHIKILQYFILATKYTALTSPNAGLLKSLLPEDNNVEDGYFRVLGAVIGLEPEVVKNKLIGPDGLMHSGLLGVSSLDYLYYQNFITYDTFHAPDSVAQKMLTHMDPNTVALSIIGPQRKGKTVRKNYRYMDSDFDLFTRRVKGAIDDPGPGRIIGVFGDRGLGKTDAMYVLEQELGVPFVFVGIAPQENGKDLWSMKFIEPKRGVVLSDLLRAGYLAKRLGIRIVLVADECELMFAVKPQKAGEDDSASKAFIANLLDFFPVTLVCTTNNPKLIDPAIRSRILWVEFAKPPAEYFAEIIREQAAEFAIPISDSFAMSIATQFADLTPRDSFKQLRSIAWAKLHGIPRTDLEKIIWDEFQTQRFVLESDDLAVLPSREPIVPAHPYLWPRSSDFDKLPSLLASSDNGFIVTLVGQEGSGKRAAAEHIAKQLGMGILERSTPKVVLGINDSSQALIEAAQYCARNKQILFLTGQEHLAYEPSMDPLHLDILHREHTPVIVSINYDYPILFLPKELVGRSLETVHFHCLDPAQCMVAYHHYFERAAPDVVQTFKTLTSEVFSDLRLVMDQMGRVFDDATIINMLHRRANEFSQIGLVDANRHISHGLMRGISLHRSAGGIDKFVAPVILPLTLEDRYKLLRKIPRGERLTWKKLSLLIEPTRNSATSIMDTAQLDSWKPKHCELQ